MPPEGGAGGAGVTAPSLRDSQLAMARYLRNPATAPPPSGIEQRRLKIYEDLVYNNIEGFVSGGFPVLRSLYGDTGWHELVRAFINRHRCHSPYFLEISREFLEYLAQEHSMRDCDPPFVAELAHYEWVELALDVSAEVLPPESPPQDDPLAMVPVLSPLAWLLSYHYPVHRIGPAFRPTEPGGPVFLLVYRDREERVRFVELNAATARLLELVRDNTGASCRDLLLGLAAELAMSEGTALDFGMQQLDEWRRQSVVFAAR
jgi:uncharacterized protein